MRHYTESRMQQRGPLPLNASMIIRQTLPIWRNLEWNLQDVELLNKAERDDQIIRITKRFEFLRFLRRSALRINTIHHFWDQVKLSAQSLGMKTILYSVDLFGEDLVWQQTLSYQLFQLNKATRCRREKGDRHSSYRGNGDILILCWENSWRIAQRMISQSAHQQHLFRLHFLSPIIIFHNHRTQKWPCVAPQQIHPTHTMCQMSDILRTNWRSEFNPVSEVILSLRYLWVFFWFHIG